MPLMKTSRDRLLLGFVLLGGTLAAVAALPVRGSGKSGLFKSAAFLEHIKYLSDDKLEGRGTGTEGVRLAGTYIAEQFKQAGLEPAGEDGTFFQPFEVDGGKEIADDDAAFKVSGLDKSWVVREDWTPLPFTKMGDIEGPLAFAGYGISAESYDYDDYADFDATGKVLLIFRYEPLSDDPDAAFGGESSSSHALFSRKARTAARKGAKALIIVNPPNRNTETDELYPWSAMSTRASYALPMVHISRSMADELLAHAQMPDVATLQQELDRGRESLSTDLLDVSVQINTGVRKRKLKARNVVGLLRGSDDADTYIIVGAHHDHIGRTRSRGSTGEKQIHNGADDNASGSAGVIELVRAFARGPRPKRSIIFMTFAGEEMGLLGSKHYVDHPTVDLDSVRAMINFDMIGRYRPELFEIWGTTTSPAFDDLVQRHAERVDLVYEAPRTTSGLFSRSDHANFFRHNIPVLFPFTGLHDQYHKPDDDWELINADGATLVLDMFHGIIDDLANLESGPEFVDPDRADAEDADNPHAPRAADAVEMPTVRLGIIPADVNGSGGLLIGMVVADGPAERAGLLDGDRIVRIGEDKIDSIQDYFVAARKLKPGDEVDVEIERDGKLQILKVKFAAAP